MASVPSALALVALPATATSPKALVSAERHAAVLVLRWACSGRVFGHLALPVPTAAGQRRAGFQLCQLTVSLRESVLDLHLRDPWAQRQHVNG